MTWPGQGSKELLPYLGPRRPRKTQLSGRRSCQNNGRLWGSKKKPHDPLSPYIRRWSTHFCFSWLWGSAPENDARSMTQSCVRCCCSTASHTWRCRGRRRSVHVRWVRDQREGRGRIRDFSGPRIPELFLSYLSLLISQEEGGGNTGGISHLCFQYSTIRLISSVESDETEKSWTSNKKQKERTDCLIDWLDTRYFRFFPMLHVTKRGANIILVDGG